MKFKDFLRQDEALITFGGKRPKYNNVVILAGGAASGKGFVMKNLLGISGKHLDVDEIKNQIVSPETVKLNKKVKSLYGIDPTDLDQTNPEDVRLLHKINDEMGISDKKEELFFRGKSGNNQHLPNVIVDSTAKSEKKIKKISDTVQDAGYQKENIHLVWVINDIDTAIKQNLNPERGRRVPEDILMDTHEMVAQSMSKLLKSNRLDVYIGGQITLVFNKEFIDSTMVYANDLLDKEGNKQSHRSGKFVKQAAMVTIKEKNRPTMGYNEIASTYIKKITQYIPKSVKKYWNG